MAVVRKSDKNDECKSMLKSLSKPVSNLEILSMAWRNLAVIPGKLWNAEEREQIGGTNWIDTERFRIQRNLPGISVFGKRI